MSGVHRDPDYVAELARLILRSHIRWLDVNYADGVFLASVDRCLAQCVILATA